MTNSKGNHWATRAEKTGRDAEEMINFLLRNLQMKYFPVHKQLKFKEYELRTAPLYSSTLVADLVVEGLPGLPEDRTILSVKFQDVGGR